MSNTTLKVFKVEKPFVCKNGTPAVNAWVTLPDGRPAKVVFFGTEASTVENGSVVSLSLGVDKYMNLRVKSSLI